MSSRLDSIFLEPELIKAAELVLDSNATAAIELAKQSQSGLNTVGPKGDTLLLLAVEGNDLKTVKALLEANADPNLTPALSPLAVAAEKAGIKVIAALLEANANPNGMANEESAIWRAALSNRFDSVQLLEKYGAQLDIGNYRGDTPLISSAKGGRFQMALLLLDLGASSFESSNDGYTAGYWASRSRIPDNGIEGKARELFVQRIRAAGFPWPPLSPEEVLVAKKRNQWPPVDN